jgi:hypothetical protein
MHSCKGLIPAKDGFLDGFLERRNSCKGWFLQRIEYSTLKGGVAGKKFIVNRTKKALRCYSLLERLICTIRIFIENELTIFAVCFRTMVHIFETFR